MPLTGVVKDERGLNIEKRYYTGSQTMAQGQVLCYQESPATASVTKGFGMDVEIPNTTNEAYFCGVVAPTSEGETGPAYIDVIIPKKKDMIQVLCSDIRAIAVGDVLMLDEDVPSATQTNGEGGLAAITLDVGTISVSAAQSVILAAATAQMIAMQKVVLAKAMQSLASCTGTAARARTLKWVQFL